VKKGRWKIFPIVGMQGMEWAAQIARACKRKKVEKQEGALARGHGSLAKTFLPFF
jgi:hypothetical protein